MQLGVGLIGLAHWYNPLLCAQAISELPELRLIAAVDNNESRLKSFINKFKIENCQRDYEKFLNDPNIDIVVISPTTNMHAEVAVNFAKAGKHIICNKPLAHTLYEAEKIIKVVKESDVKLTIPYITRYFPTNAKIKELIDQGVIGQLKTIYAEIQAPPPWTGMPKELSLDWFADPSLATGGGFIDEGVFLIDLMRWFSSADIEQVYAEIGNLVYKELNVEDYGAALLRFKNTTIGFLESGWIFPSKHHAMSTRIKIIGKRGEITLDVDRRPSLSLYNKKDEKRIYFDLTTNYLESYKRFLKDFVEAIIKHYEPFITGSDGKISLEVCLAAYESAKKGRAIILSDF